MEAAGVTTAGADIVNLWKAVACAASAGHSTNRGATGSTAGTGTTTAGCSDCDVRSIPITFTGTLMYFFISRMPSNKRG